jgi:flagellar motor component MotA
VLLGIAAIVPSMVMGEVSLAILFNGPSLLIVVAGTALLGLAHHSPAEFKTAFAAGFGGEPLSTKEALKHAAVLSTLRLLALGCGVAGTFIGLIKMLQNLNDPTKIGPAIAIALLTTLYGIMLAGLVFGPLGARVGAGTSKDSITAAGPNGAYLIGLILGTLLSFFVMLVAMASFD